MSTSYRFLWTRTARLDVQFNLSHAGERALLAVAIGRELGVDIEEERCVDVLGIARRYFSPSEYLALVSLPEERRVGAFYRCWTRKESFLKARGEGLAFPLSGFEVSLAQQRLFLGWAQGWCENARPEAERVKAAINPHSSNRYRVNGPSSNMPEFQKAFSCNADAPMVRRNACRVW